jgi:hypothetical protein
VPSEAAWLAADASEVLADLERRLEPGSPERIADLAVVGYGEVSAVLTYGSLPGTVLKRMGGLADRGRAETYVALVAEYVARLRARGVQVADTASLVVPRASRPPVVYHLQRRVDADQIGHAVLATGDDDAHAEMLRRVLAVVGQSRRPADDEADDVDVAVDAQLSNWHVRLDDPTARPVLLDVGTPFLRRSGRQAMDPEIILTTAPAPLRPLFRRLGTVHSYFDDYFDLRTAAVDLLGNYHKEGRPDRIDDGLRIVNRWLAAQGHEPVTRREIDRYYRSDALLLGFWLSARRVDRAVRRLGGRGYDFVLPGRVRR